MTSDKAYSTEQRLNALGLWADANGVNRYTAVDSNTYSTGVYRQHLGGNVTIESAKNAPLQTVLFEHRA